MNITKITAENYAAKVCVIDNISKHPGADNLQLVSIDGDVAIVNMSYKKGDVVIKFPLECAINKNFLSACNAFEEKIANKDTSQKGFFNKHGRVRAIKLRGVFCGCYLHPVEDFNKFFGTSFSSSDAGLEFNEVNGTIVCEKYVPLSNKKNVQNLGEKKPRKVQNKDLIEDSQFRFHWDTSHFGRNIHKVEPGDIISVTYKLHGTSGISANVLLKRKLTFIEKVAKFFGAKVVESEYGFVAASRKVIKAVENNSLANNNHYYDTDIWKHVTEVLRPHIQKGITLYYEVVGFTPSGSFIQKGFDYGFNRVVSGNEKWEIGKHFGVYVYRITYTTPDGKVIEFDWSMVKEYCDKYGLLRVPEIYHGRADGFAPTSEEILTRVSMEIEKNCHMCANIVPAEGYVIRRETRGVDAFKVKSELFRLMESKELDSGEQNIEDQDGDTEN